ncbi:MAG: hypothetical protein GEU83_19085 [Pseudonocardiaceae bacterium]|nr:hypothetical protein [Pseudonocardiaceae bacterium]
MQRGSAVILILGCALALTGCSQGPDRERVTDTDRQRLQLMLDEPIVREAEQDMSKQPGTLRADNTLKRGFVSVSVFSVFAGEREQPVRPALTKRRTADALGVLRDSGWTIASASCTVPEPDGPDDALQWESTAYKHVDGVSYWANLTAAAIPSRLGVVDIALRAPNVDDPPDLFPRRPAGLPAGSTCIEQSGMPDEGVEQGAPVQMEQVGPQVGPAAELGQ